GSWFFKLAGDPSLVDQQKPAFVEFLKSIAIRDAKPRPEVTWKLPAGWKEAAPTKMSLANFSMGDGTGKEGEVSIVQLGHMEGKDAEVINIFRAKFGQPQLTEQELRKQIEVVSVGQDKGNLFELSREHQHAAGESSEGQFHWTVPAQWKPASHNQMQVARFTVPQKGTGTGEVFVSVFDSESGGTLANVNRWRTQLGLTNTTEKALSEVVSPLDPALPGSILVDMTNSGKRLIGAIVPRKGSFWFYKLLGDAEAVSSEKLSFIAFAKSEP
ncbi:MAG TPA: hypothetical protein VMZ27_17815, partial [Candidatus Saccharimonadales bacterium]|nr:hypothetical protein [Candidatus Saccharimonadales bacterium]